MSDLLETMRQMIEARPPTKPAPVSDLAKLLAGGTLPVQVRPEAKPSASVDVKDAARKQLDAAGRFTVAPDHAPKVSRPQGLFPQGLFGGIAQAGPKPRKPRPKPEEKKEAVVKLSLQLLKELGEDAIPIKGNSRIAQAFRKEGVQESGELSRILSLPRRPADLNQYPDLTEEFRRPGGEMRLWPVQNAALAEAKKANGLLAPVGVGHGKTIISLLVGLAMNAKRIVVLVPPQLRVQLIQRDIPKLSKHFRLPLDRMHVIAYSELSSAKSADVLEQLNPDLIVADECHNLRHRSAARTKRFLRYLKDHPECRFVGLSGTITRRSLKDFGHLSELALRARSPVPHNWHTLNEWAEALDVSKDPMPPGALIQLCSAEEAATIRGTADVFEAQQAVRSAFRRRLVETPGVVATEEGAIGTSLVITGLRPLVPAEVQVALRDLRTKWEIAGDELVDILSVIRVGCQLAGGFFYRWIWPNGEPDREWLDARSAWNKELREILKLNRKGLDSPLLVTNAILRGELESDAWAAWAEVKGRYNPEPPREAVWISDYLVRESVKWASDCTKTAPGIIWYQWEALGRAVAQMGGFPFMGAGTDEEMANVNVKKTPVIVASQRAHGTGKNLQDFCRNLFTTPMGGGVDWEQTLARTHRPGQLADEVTADVFVHTEEMERTFRSALRDARYIETTQGQRQKLIYAEKVNLPEEEDA